MPTHVLAYDDRSAVGLEQPGGMQPAGAFEPGLVLAQPVGSRSTISRDELDRRRGCRVGQHVLHRVGAAHAAGGVDQPGRRQRQRGSGELDGDDVELLELGQLGVGAVTDGTHVLAPGDPLVHQPAGRELEVVTRRPHRHGDPLGRGPRRLDPDLQRLLGGDAVLVVEACAVAELGHRARTDGPGRRERMDVTRSIVGARPISCAPWNRRSRGASHPWVELLRSVLVTAACAALLAGCGTDSAENESRRGPEPARLAHGLCLQFARKLASIGRDIDLDGDGTPMLSE